MLPGTATASSPLHPQGTGPVVVRHLRQVMLWPLRLIPANVADDSERRRAPWQLLRELGDATPWREHFDEYTGDAGGLHERHYNEFVTFLPYVQRFLYGEGRARREGDPRSGESWAPDTGEAGTRPPWGGPAPAESWTPGTGNTGTTRQAGARSPWGGPAPAESPMRIFRRHDIAALRVVPQAGDAPVTLSVAHIDLYFFYGVDVVLLNVELAADELPLPLVQELLYGCGRAYPAGWHADGRPQHSPARCEWLDAAGHVLAASDTHERDAFLAHVAEHRAPRVAAHWEFVLAPLVNHHSARPGTLRFRQIEYYRMPMMAYLAVDDPRRLTRNDFVRLGLVVGGEAAGHGSAGLPYAEQHLADFEQRFCYDRFWSESGAAPNTRYLCSGHALVVVGDARSEFYACAERGVLAQFRHQHFLLFLIAHFQKATLLMASDQLAEALMALDLTRPASIKRFKRQIRMSYVSFLSFTHRYWFHEVSEQAQVKALFDMCTRHLQIEPLYHGVKERIHDMNSYLDADSLRRQANTVVRLTVVTIFGLIGTVTTGFLGMNLIAEAEAPLLRKLWLFMAVFIPTIVLTMYTMVKSKRLSDFLDAVSDERLPAWAKLKAFIGVWRREPG